MFFTAHILTAILVLAKVFEQVNISWILALAPSIVAITVQVFAVVVIMVIAAWASK